MTQKIDYYNATLIPFLSVGKVGGLSSHDPKTIVGKVGNNNTNSQTISLDPEQMGGDYWTSKSNKLDEISTSGAATLNGFGYNFGGYDTFYACDVEQYNDTTDLWVTKQALIDEKLGNAGATLNGFAYCYGGGKSGTHVCDTEQYNDTDDTWTVKDLLTHDRESLDGSSLNGFLYAIGGWQSPNRVCYTEQYNDATDLWTDKQDLINDRQGLAVSTLNGFIYSFGGLDTTYRCWTEQYNDSLDLWTAKQDTVNDLNGVKGNTIGGFMYGIGGHDGTYRAYNEQYNDVTDSWVAKKDVSNAGYFKAIVSLNENIYACGGGTSSSASYTEQYRSTNNYQITTSFKKSAKTPTNIFVNTTIDGRSTNLPILLRTSGNENDLIWTEQFDNIIWLKSGTGSVSSNTTIAPDGTTTADTITDSDVDVNEYLLRQQDSSIVDDTTIRTLSIFLKEDTAAVTTIRLRYNGSPINSALATITWATHVASYSGDSGGSADVQDMGDGWYRLSVTSRSNTGTGTSDLETYFYPAGVNASVTGAVIAWGAMRNNGSTPGPYIKVEESPVDLTAGYFDPSWNFMESNVDSALKRGGTLSTDFQINGNGFRDYQIRVGIPHYVAGEGAGIWATRASLNNERDQATGLSIGGFGYLTNGLTTGSASSNITEKYSDSSDTWLVVAASIWSARPSGFSLGGFGYTMGTATAVDKYNPDTNSWSVSGARSNLLGSKGGSLNEYGYAHAGGQNSSVERYDQALNTWAAVIGSTVVNNRHGIFSINGFLNVMAGNNAGDGLDISHHEQYNDAGDIFSSKAKVSEGRENGVGYALESGYFSGGDNGVTERSTTEQYNTGDFWNIKAGVTTPKNTHSSFALNKSGYSVAGFDSSARTSSMEQYTQNESVHTLNVSLIVDEE